MRSSRASRPPCRLGAARSATMISSCYGLTCAAGAEHRRACRGKSEGAKTATSWVRFAKVGSLIPSYESQAIRARAQLTLPSTQVQDQPLKPKHLDEGSDRGARHRVNRE